MQTAALILAYALATEPVPPPHRLPDADAPRLACLILDGDIRCNVARSPLAPLKSLRPRPRPEGKP